MKLVCPFWDDRSKDRKIEEIKSLLKQLILLTKQLKLIVYYGMYRG